jgi:hypothetical protein
LKLKASIMSDANLEVRFSASIDDLTKGVAEVKDALADLAASASQMNGQYASLGASIAAAMSPDKLRAFDAALLSSVSLEKSLAAAHDQAAKAIKEGDDASYSDAVRAARLAINDEVKAVEDGLKQKLTIYAAEVQRHEITQQEKAALSRQAMDEEYQAELALLQKEAALSGQSLAQHTLASDRILDAERRHQDQITQLVQRSLTEQQREYEGYANAVTQAFNAQLRGLLAGTTSWHAAITAMLSDLLIKFIEWGETTVVQHIANEAAKTAATSAGVAARTGAEQAGASASLAAQGATMIRSILSSAAEAFAGVFGFLSPIMGPLAAGPAAAAQATVAGMAGAVASADIGMWQVPADMLTLVHHNELVMPAAQASAFRDMLSSAGQDGAPPSSRTVHIHPTTNFHVSALDSGSVAQWVKANSGSLAKAMDEAARHGALLGLRRLGA